MPESSVLFVKNNYHPKAKQGTDFEQEFSFPHERGVAFHNDHAFFASGINEGGSVHFLEVSHASLASLKVWIARTFADTNPIESQYKPGTVYKRIYRPLASTGSYYRAVPQEKVTESFVSLHMLLKKLEELFETIEPTEANLAAYGHKIREILLLACMEVESSWSAVLKENCYPSTGRLTTNDYVKLLTAMLLDSYKLSLQSYSTFPSFSPFEGWSAANPTQSLAWYDAYNKTKHDREENLKLATLHNAVRAVGAAVVMFHAQFGLSFGTGDQKTPVIRNVFRIVTDFKKHWQECYIPKLTVAENASPNPLPSFDWIPINYQF